MNYLLDANAWIDSLRKGTGSKVTIRLLATPPGSVHLCSVVLGELIYGAIHSGPAHQTANLASIAKLRNQFQSLPFDDSAAEEYGTLRDTLTSQGLLIGPNDLMIASIALARQLTVVTHNTAEFSRVPNLLLEDWQ